MNKKLYRAAESDDVESLEDLLRQGLDIFNEVSCGGNTVLHISAFHGSKKIIGRVLPSADHEFLRKQNVHGNTALHQAADGGKYEVVEILLNHWSVLANLRNTAGETAVFKAALAGHTDIIDMFEYLLRPVPVEMYRRESDGQTLLHCAVSNKRTV